MPIVTQLSLTGAILPEPIDFARPGLPALDAVRDAITLTPPGGGASYLVLRTTEFDTYESSPATAAVAQLLQQGSASPAAIAEALAAARGPITDNFVGTARAAAKLSVGNRPTERFSDVSALVGTLVADRAMIEHVPVIDTSRTSTRVAEEQRTVHVVGFLYAASREADNDFHLIVGRDPATPPEMYMTMEVSGLPPATNPAFQAIKSARDAFQSFFGAHQPQLSYDYYHPPIPVEIDGSLFFDMTHAVGQAPGPPSLKSRMPTIWEVHPLTSIVLGRARAA